MLLPFCLKAQTGFISVNWKDIVTPDGKCFIMRGTNLGNWLMPEGYMFKFSKTNSPRLINEAITELLGPAMKPPTFLEKIPGATMLPNPMSPLSRVKSIGVNSIRIPFNYKIFTN